MSKSSPQQYNEIDRAIETGTVRQSGSPGGGRISALICWVVVLAIAGCSASGRAASSDDFSGTVVEVDSARVVADISYLSSPELQGRAAGTEGSEAARAYIQAELERAGIRPLSTGWFQSFIVPTTGVEGRNVIGVVQGMESPDRYIVVTAHFDHLGVRDGEIYHGADDNASGSAALLEIARYFAGNPPRNSVVFAALDAEEMGLRGARAFVADPPIPLESILLNINMDMVSRSVADELYVAGTHHYPFLNELIDVVADRSNVTLLRGHDDPSLPAGDDWTMASDHGAFHAEGIPFLYFGVEDHPDYHQPTDTFENIDQSFFVRAVRTVLDAVAEADVRAEAIAAEMAPVS